MSGLGDRVNPRTGQTRVAINENLAYNLFEDQSVDGLGEATSAAVDVERDKDITLLVKTTKAFIVQVQFTDIETPNEDDWFDYCNTSGVAIPFTANFTPGRAIPITCKASKMRVFIKNTEATADTPKIRVM